LIYDIKELDDTGVRMRASWTKATNYFHVFAKDYLEARAAFKSGRYGTGMTFQQWLGKYVGVVDSTAAKMILLHCKNLEANERRQLELAEKERIQKQKNQREEVRLRKMKLQLQRRQEMEARIAAKEAAIQEKKRLEKNRKDRERRARIKAEQKLEFRRVVL
jgi:hypothetical protein